MFDVPQNIGIGDALHRIVREVAAGVKRGLEINALHRRMLQAEAHDGADFVLVHTALDGWNQNHRAADFRQPVQRAQFLGKKIGLAANDAIGLALEAVELEIDVRPDPRQLIKETVVGGDALAVGVQHHVGDAAPPRRLHHGDDPRMDGRLAARKLHHLGIAFGRDQMVQDLFHFFKRQVEPRARLGET